MDRERWRKMDAELDGGMAGDVGLGKWMIFVGGFGFNDYVGRGNELGSWKRQGVMVPAPGPSIRQVESMVPGMWIWYFGHSSLRPFGQRDKAWKSPIRRNLLFGWVIT